MYTGIVSQAPLSYNYGVGFAFAWATVGLAFITGALQQASANVMPDSEESQSVEPQP